MFIEFKVFYNQKLESNESFQLHISDINKKNETNHEYKTISKLK